MDGASLPSAGRGPVDFRALTLFAINFEALIFKIRAQLLLKLPDLQRHLLMYLRPETHRVVKLYHQPHVLEFALDQAGECLLGASNRSKSICVVQ